MAYNSLAELFTAIANSIRGKTGGTEKIVANDFPAAIDGISSGGGDEWYITDASYLFYKGARLDAMEFLVPKLKNLTSMRNMFYECETGLTHVDMSGLDTSKVTDMYGVFGYCRNLKSVDVSGFDTSNVTNMAYMFAATNKLTFLDVSGFDTSNVTDMSSMFSGYNGTTLDVSSFDTSKVTRMYMMLACPNITSIDMSGFNTSNVTDMSQMFGSGGYTTLDFSNFDTGKVTTMSYMFQSCKKLAEITGFSATNKAGVPIGFPAGTSTSSRVALKRLTFRTDLPDGVYSIRSRIDIRYCSFERDGMVEMFNTLPDVSGLTHSTSYKTITITGNPCVTDGSLTAEDEAIATAKGWTLVK